MTSGLPVVGAAVCDQVLGSLPEALPQCSNRKCRDSGGAHVERSRGCRERQRGRIEDVGGSQRAEMRVDGQGKQAKRKQRLAPAVLGLVATGTDNKLIKTTNRRLGAGREVLGRV